MIVKVAKTCKSADLQKVHTCMKNMVAYGTERKLIPKLYHQTTSVVSVLMRYEIS